MNSIEESRKPSRDEEIHAITEAARDFIEGWYLADADRMKRSLHPDLVKRSIYRDTKDGLLRLRRAADASMMIEWTREGGGSDLPSEDQTYEITVLDTFRHIATVMVKSYMYVDYLHIAKIEGSWIIVNDLWELREGELSGE